MGVWGGRRACSVTKDRRYCFRLMVTGGRFRLWRGSTRAEVDSLDSAADEKSSSAVVSDRGEAKPSETGGRTSQ